MPISPGKNEKQEDWMARCVPEMMGKNGGTKRPNEQAVAACLTMWRDKDKSLKRQIEPDDGEEYGDFLDRCVEQLTGEGVDEDDAEDRCSVFWEESDIGNPSGLRGDKRLRYRTHSAPVVNKEFILSDESRDRLGDIIMAGGWQLDNFRRNPVALWNHRGDFPIGLWEDIRVQGTELRGRLKLAPAGTSDRIDEIRRLVEAGILRAVSVGFHEITHEPLKSIDGFSTGGVRFTKQELIETSLVSVPANANALAVAKSLVSPSTIDLVFAKPGKGRAIRRRAARQASRNISDRITPTMEVQTPLGGRITAAQKRLVALQDQLEAHLRNLDDEDVSDADMATTADLNAKISAEQRTHSMLLESEQRLLKTALTTDDGNGNGNGNGNGALVVSSPAITARHRPWSIPPKKIEPIDYFFRSLVVTVLRHAGRNERSANDIIKERYGEDDITGMLVTRNASAPANMTTAGWAQELVSQIWMGFQQALIPYSILPALAGRGQSYTFGPNGAINLPMRAQTPQLGGSFVGEGAPIPVRQGAFVTLQLTPKKLAVISTFTRELAEHSTPAIEGIIRESIVVDTATAINAVLMDTNPSTAVRPAGLLYNVSGLTPTAGGGVNALIGDIKLLIDALNISTLGNLRDPVWLMTPANVSAAALTPTTVGVLPFREEIAGGTLMGIPIIKSASVPLNTMILMDAADFAVAGDPAPRFDVSDQAVLHMEDTSPASIIGGTSGAAVPAVPTRSLWQTDTIGVRMIQPLNWLMRRTGMVQWMTGMTWV